MDTRFSDEQELLRESARDFLARECPISLVRDQMDDPVGLPAALWKQMAELGWIGLIVDEAHGGSGLGMIDLAVLMEEMGRALCPGPFLSTAVTGALLLQWAGSEEQKRRLLPPLVEGGLHLALAQLEDDASWGPEAIRLHAEPDGDGLRLDGRKCFVSDAPSADRLIVAVRTAPPGTPDAEAITLVLVAADEPGVGVRPIAYNEQTRKLGEVTFEGVRGEILGPAGGGWPLLARAHDHARAAICAELSGSAQRVLELSVAYAKSREQFGQPIGRFQAIQHRCANMLVKAEGIRAAAYYAAWALEVGDPGAHTTACLAKSYANEAASAVAGDGIQIHGGLGFTWEQDLHLYYKHAKAAEFLYGSPSECRELAARQLIDEAGAPYP